MGISKSGSKYGEAPEEEMFETFESVQVYDVDQYLDVVLSRQRASQGSSGVNFMTSS